MAGRSAAALIKKAQTLAAEDDESMIDLAEVVWKLGAQPRLPEALRTRLRPADRRPPLAHQGRRQAPQPTPVPTRPALPARRRRGGHAALRPNASCVSSRAVAVIRIEGPMRFLEDGADIPDVVLRAANAGNVTFLCGAGVSFRVGLPSFKYLTE